MTMVASGISSIVAEIRSEVRTCSLCPGMAPHEKVPASGWGTIDTGYMLVGEAPGRDGNDGTAFQTPAGLVVREALAAVGHARYRTLEDLFYLTHAVRCVPPVRKSRKKKGAPKAKADAADDAITRLRPPSRKECLTCRPFLQLERRALHPKLTITLGLHAATAVLGRPIRMDESHGRRWRLRDGELLTLISTSPHNRRALSRLDMSFDGYRRWLTGLFGALIDELT